jgi:hypothetical protein
VKGYRLYDVEKERIIHSRSVIFHEDLIGFERFSEWANETQRILELDDNLYPLEEEQSGQPEKAQSPLLLRTERRRRPPDASENGSTWLQIVVNLVLFTKL